MWSLLRRHPWLTLLLGLISASVGTIAAFVMKEPYARNFYRVREVRSVLDSYGRVLELEFDSRGALPSVWPPPMAERLRLHSAEPDPVAHDPWGTPYEYTRTGDLFTLLSRGPDRKPSDDDIIYVSGRGIVSSVP
jgi:hypothetical protein